MYFPLFPVKLSPIQRPTNFLGDTYTLEHTHKYTHRHTRTQTFESNHNQIGFLCFYCECVTWLLFVNEFRTERETSISSVSGVLINTHTHTHTPRFYKICVACVFVCVCAYVRSALMQVAARQAKTQKQLNYPNRQTKIIQSKTMLTCVELLESRV